MRSLKKRLTQLHGLPPRFRQRLLLDGETLEDTAKLDCPTSLELVLLTFADVSSPHLSATFEFVSYDTNLAKNTSLRFYLHIALDRGQGFHHYKRNFVAE